METDDSYVSNPDSDPDSELIYAEGSPDTSFSPDELKEAVFDIFDGIDPALNVLIIPPDFTRFHSQAGQITQYAYEYYEHSIDVIMPALGTHAPMRKQEIEKMFGDVPKDLFMVHNWREDVLTLGEVPAEYVAKVSEGAVDYAWPAQVNRLLIEGDYDLIISIGQVVPHEVIGMANYNKNIFVGIGGAEGINKSHFIGAAYGMERIMGRVDNPVRKVMNYANRFIDELPIVYIQTVVSAGADGLQVRGVYAGTNSECFEQAAALSLKVNFNMMDREMRKVVVYLDPDEFKTTWVGNKSIYRTRMAIADGGELIILAPAVERFGEDPVNDRLIRKYGYVPTPKVLSYVKENDDLRKSLGVAAHLIHGTSEGRFRITYCPGRLSREEIERAGFEYAELKPMMRKYNPAKLRDGWNMVDGEEIYYISNPALGLWAYKEKFV